MEMSLNIDYDKHDLSKDRGSLGTQDTIIDDHIKANKERFANISNFNIGKISINNRSLNNSK